MTSHTVLLRICLVLLLLQNAHAHDDPGPHICLIGAGITSASISHFLTKVPLKPTPRITVFEKSAKVGGRIASVELQTKHKTIRIEAGASIIAEGNQLMSYFANFLNLARASPPHRTVGLWDGKAFSIRTFPGAPLRTRAAFALRYRLSILRMKSFVADLMSRYSQIYPKDGPASEWRACDTVEHLFDKAQGLYNLTQVRFDTVLAENFGTRFSSEMVAAITRVNYGQDPIQMNGCSGAVALAGSGTDLWSIEGGNVQVVKGLLARSGAQLLLNTSIRRLLLREDQDEKFLNIQTESKDWTCDVVVLAAPFELAEIALPPELVKSLDVGRKFQRTYATFVRGRLNEKVFGSDPPDSVLTTEHVNEPFTSIGTVWSAVDAEEPPIFKVFSTKSLDERAMSRMFLKGAEKLTEFPWLAYPRFNPPEQFPGFVVDLAGGAFIYTSPVESAGSAMEMSAVSGANAAALIQKKLGLRPEAQDQLLGKEEL